MDDKPKKSPIPGTLSEAAVAMNEMFLSYVAAGFTRAEALQICIALTTETMRLTQPNNE